MREQTKTGLRHDHGLLPQRHRAGFKHHHDDLPLPQQHQIRYQRDHSLPLQQHPTPETKRYQRLLGNASSAPTLTLISTTSPLRTYSLNAARIIPWTSAGPALPRTSSSGFSPRGPQYGSGCHAQIRTADTSTRTSRCVAWPTPALLRSTTHMALIASWRRALASGSAFVQVAATGRCTRSWVVVRAQQGIRWSAAYAATPCASSTSAGGTRDPRVMNMIEVRGGDRASS
jgi:hypothetical protein